MFGVAQAYASDRQQRSADLVFGSGTSKLTSCPPAITVTVIPR